MELSIKTIEDLSLNAWPSHQMQVYDGWILRFSHFYTHRTNCVEPIGASILPLAEKIAYCLGESFPEGYEASVSGDTVTVKKTDASAPVELELAVQEWVKLESD